MLFPLKKARSAAKAVGPGQRGNTLGKKEICKNFYEGKIKKNFSKGGSRSYQTTGTAPAARIRSAASSLVAKSMKACTASEGSTLLLVTKTKGRWIL